MTTGEYFKNFLTAVENLERRGNVEFSRKADLQLAKRLSDGKFVYYRKQDEEDLVGKGLLGPEYQQGTVGHHYKSIQEIIDQM